MCSTRLIQDGGKLGAGRCGVLDRGGAFHRTPGYACGSERVFPGTVLDGTEVEKFEDLGDGEGRRVRREVTGEEPRVLRSDTTLVGGFVEDDDFGLERGDCQVVEVTGGLRRMDETWDGGTCVDDEEEVVDVEKDDDEGHVVRMREGQVGMVTLDGVNKVGDIEVPKEGRKMTTLRARLKTTYEGSTCHTHTGLSEGLEHLKIETKLINDRFASAMGECVILTTQVLRQYSK